MFLLGERHALDAALPFEGEQHAHALVDPVHLLARAEEDAAQHEREDAVRMRLGVGERQRRAPGAAREDPALDHPEPGS